MAVKLDVVIAGAGVAGLEAAFALHESAGGHINLTVVAPESEFVLRPVTLREPMAAVRAERYSLAAILADAGAEVLLDRFRWLDAPNRIVHTRDGRELPYDAFVLALGARRRAAMKHGLTLNERRLWEQAQSLLSELERGDLRRLALLVPAQSGWSLPMYELALLMAGRARALNAPLEVILVTAERAPAAVFGARASRAVGALLERQGVQLVTSANCDVPEPGVVSLRPGLLAVSVDRVVSLPRLYGPSTPGVPKRARGGFLSVDAYSQVRGLLGVYAAGDATDSPVKFGAVAAQQADTAASSIAAAAGVTVTTAPLTPMIHATLQGDEGPLYLRAHLTGGRGSRAVVSDTRTWKASTRVDAFHLAAYLESRARARQ